MIDAVGATHYGYNSVGQLLSEDGPWDNDTLTYAFNNRLRSNLSLVVPNASPWAQSYSYDTAKRLTNVTSVAGAFGYQYVGGGSLVNFLRLPNRSYIQNSGFDSVARLLSTYLINSDGTNLDAHVYGYNLAGQRTNNMQTAESYAGYRSLDL